MPDSQIPPLALAFAGFVLAMKPDSPTTAIAFIAAVGLFGFTKWLDKKASNDLDVVRSDLKALKDKVESNLISKGFGR